MIAVLMWGACSWGFLNPQQFRLASLNPPMTSVLVGLNTSSTYIGVSIAGAVGAAAIPLVGAHHLGFFSSIAVVVALLVSELASRRIASVARTTATATA